ncbi:hypothetical protein [Streptomyces sp. NPDC002602]|uniref:hypothetical protein n=1 Tax=Streptomyces sp. NPDC002602 TaxID=3364654 RepID=UPI0036A13C94
MLAEAFCASDDRMRQAQSLLDRAQADRTRTLAAFAVSIGSDGGVANLMGLHEREVRRARRVVGKADARSVAEELLRRHAASAPPQRREAEPECEASPAVLEPLPAEIVLPHPRVETAPSSGGASPGAVAWTSSMDSVLLWSWQSGLDLSKVAAELGVNYSALLLRAQQLAAEGRLAVKPVHTDTGQAGRHRRHEAFHLPVPDSPTSLYNPYAYPYI